MKLKIQFLCHIMLISNAQWLYATMDVKLDNMQKSIVQNSLIYYKYFLKKQTENPNL